MMTVREASSLYEMSGHRLKQIIKEEKLEVHKLSNGYIRIPNATMSALNHLRDIQYQFKILTIGMEKGGLGKTILTINLAICAARKGLKVLVNDFDPECCASLFLAPDDTDWDELGSIREVFLNEKQILDYVIPSRFDGVDFLPSKSRVRKIDRQLDGQNPKHLLRKVSQGIEGYYDLVLNDVPPSFNNLCRASYLSSDIIICPVNDDVFSIDSLHLTIEDIEEACEEFEVEQPLTKVLRNKFTISSKEKSSKSSPKEKPSKSSSTKKTSDDAAEPKRKLRKASYDIGAELNREFSDLLLPFHIRDTDSVKNALNEGYSFFDAPRDKYMEEVKTAIEDLFFFIQSCN